MKPEHQALGAGDPDHLRGLLAEDHVQERDDRESEREGDDRRCRVADPAVEDGLDRLRDRRFAEEADRQRGEGDPDLRGRDVLVDVIELAERDLGPPVALVGERLASARAASGRPRTRQRRSTR